MYKNNIRIFCLLLIAFMLPVLWLPAGAQMETAQEIEVKNAGFEEIEGDWVKDWSNMGGNAEYKVDSKTVHTGKKSIHISNSETTNPWAAQSVYGLLEGSLYELSVFVNADVTGNRGAGIKVEFYSANEASAETAIAANANIPDVYPNGQYITNTNDRWVEHKTIFYVPEGTKMVKVYVRLYGQGDAWFDDVSLKFSGGPAKYTFDTKKVFHYKEETGGEAFVNIDNFYKNEGVGEDTLVDFAVYDGDSLCEKAENVKPVAMSARYTYSTSYMEPYKKYTLKCTIKNAKGEVLEEHQQNLYVVDRPTMMNEEGYLMVDGKRFNPITAYHVQPVDYAKAAESGINTVQIGYGSAIVANTAQRELTVAPLKEHGLYGIFSLYIQNKNAGHPDNFENTKTIVEMLKDDPNIIAWALQDEPFITGDDKEKRLHCEEAYLAIRQIDKTRPIYICDKRNDAISSKYCDIYCVDSYARMGNTRAVSEETRKAMEATREKNAFWELAATYYSSNVQNMSSMNDARNSIYRAFEEGARGMGYYAFSDALLGYQEKTQLYEWEDWELFCRFNKEEAPILFDRFVNGEAIVFNECDDGAGTGGIDSMKWFDWFVGEDMYLAAHNRGRDTKEITIPLKSKNGKISIGGFKAEPIGLTTQSAMSGNGEMTLTLGSEEIALFKIIPDMKVDLSKINDVAFDDLEGYDWAKEAIEALDSRGVVNTVAEGKYGPGQAITRLDFVSFLVRALGLTAEGEAFPDCDVKEIKIARAAGITQGDTDGNFRPNDTITRQDIMTTAARALKVTATDKEIPVFSDWSLISDYALDAVKCMVQAEVIVGNGDGTLTPLGNATRAEAAVMLHRILNTTFETVGSTPSAPQTPTEVREEITFTEQVDANTLERWSDAADLMGGLGLGRPEIEKSVTKGDFEGYVQGLIGTEFNAFSDDLKALKYAEAVEEMVKLLGYEAQAQAGGGFMAMAAQLDLTSGISAGEYIRGGELARLFENALDIKVAERTAYGDDERYKESEDTLLSLYKNIYKITGVVEGDWYTGAAVKKNEILIGGEAYAGGEGFLGQRVVVYAEHTDDAKNVVYIKAANSAETVTLDREDILEANTSMVRYEDENGREVTVSVSGAKLFYNGSLKTGWTAADLLPAMGTVTLMQHYGSGADYILVEAYENRVVQSAYADEKKVYFKNGPELLLDKNSGTRFYMDFEIADLKEWNIVSVMLRADGSVYKVKLSAESATGAPSEISDDGVLIGETTFGVAENCFGIPVLGTEAKFYLDFAGKIAALDDKDLTTEYGYFTAMAGGKGLDGGVSLRIFTKDGEMKVFPVADTVKLNGAPKNPADLLSASVLLDGEKAKSQLVVYELNDNGEVIELETALDALNCDHKDTPEEFAKVYVTSGWGGHYVGYNQKTIGSLYRITDTTVTFMVPKEYSDNPEDYSVSIGNARYEHSSVYYDCSIYDWKKNFTVGAIVQELETNLQTVEDNSRIGVFMGLGDALDDDGMVRKAIRLVGNSGRELTYYAEEDIKVLLDSKTLTDLSKETEVTETEGKKTLNPYMSLSALNVGDVVHIAVNAIDGVTITAMRVLLRAKSPKIGETNTKSNAGDRFDYSPLATAYGEVTETFEDGIAMFPGAFERIYMHYWSGGTITPVIILDQKRGTYESATVNAIRVGDKVFVRKNNPYLELYVVYR